MADAKRYTVRHQTLHRLSVNLKFSKTFRVMEKCTNVQEFAASDGME